MASQALDLSAGLQPAQPAQPPQQGGMDLSAGLQPASPAPAPQQPQGIIGTMADNFRSNIGPVEDVAKGIGEGAMDTVGTAAGLLHKGLGESVVSQGRVDAIHKLAAPTDTAQSIGKGIESVAEFMLGDEALKGLSLTEKLGKIAPTVARLEKSPRLLKIAQTAIRQGTVGTAQAAAHGDSAGGSLLTGGVAGVTGGALEGAGQLYNAIKPTETTIAGVTMPKLRSQVEGGSKIGDSTAANTPKIAQAQQAGGQQAAINIAQRSTKNALDRVNLTRPSAVSDALAPSEPYTFTVDLGGDSRAAANDALPGPQRGLTDGTDQPQAQATRTAQTYRTQDPVEAQRMASQMQDYADSEHYSNLSPEEKAHFDTARGQLDQQLGMYRAATSGSRFAPIDSEGIAGKITSFGEGADQIRAQVKPVYEKLDELSGGKFDAFKKQFNAAQKVIRNGQSIDAINAAHDAAKEAEAGVNQLLTTHAGQISRADYMATKSAWRDASILDTVHNSVEGMFNGISAQDAADTGIKRRITRANTDRIGALVKKAGRADLTHVLGEDGLQNLYRVADLLQKPDRASKAFTLVQHTAHYAGRGGTGALLGAAAAKATGNNPYEWGAGGFLAGVGSRAVLRQMATNPRIGQLMEYAVKNGVDPKIAVPLISGMLSSGAQAVTTPAPGGTQ